MLIDEFLHLGVQSVDTIAVTAREIGKESQEIVGEELDIGYRWNHTRDLLINFGNIRGKLITDADTS